MKFQLTMKDPDGVYESMRDFAESSVKNIEGIDDDEREQLADERHRQLKEKLSRWIAYGEYLDVEFDLDTMTARVLERGK